MKFINLNSLIEATSKLSSSAVTNYLEHFEIAFDSDEIDDLAILVQYLKSNGLRNVNNFFVGYKIKQISKQFDLLRIGENSIINIELKRTSTEPKIEKQLTQNRYYLGFLGKPVHTFTFVSDTQELYQLDKTNTLSKVSSQVLVDILHTQILIDVIDIDSLFKPSNYLVSPFNSTDKFISDEYFLTEHQNNIKKEILDSFNKGVSVYASISGKPGTGKTLITYDIAKTLRNNGNQVLIVHSGYLNEGHHTLISQYGWNIFSIKDYKNNSNLHFSHIIIDEAQRIDRSILHKIQIEVAQNNAKCIFSYDPEQCLSKKEEINNIGEEIRRIALGNQKQLTEKIRTNKEIASFIVSLFDKNKTNPTEEYKNINIQYFEDNQSAKNYANLLTINGWEVINFTNSLYNKVSYDDIQPLGVKNSHNVIGQEFDNVAVFIDHHFYYNTEKKLEASFVSGGAYSIDKMLYQNLTRTREKLTIIIVGNSPMLNAILEILKPNSVVIV